jgi:hypothetical protein
MSKTVRLLVRAATGFADRLEGPYLFRRALIDELNLVCTRSAGSIGLEIAAKSRSLGKRIGSTEIECLPRLSGHSKVADLRNIVTYCRRDLAHPSLAAGAAGCATGCGALARAAARRVQEADCPCAVAVPARHLVRREAARPGVAPPFRPVTTPPAFATAASGERAHRYPRPRDPIGTAAARYLAAPRAGPASAPRDLAETAALAGQSTATAAPGSGEGSRAARSASVPAAADGLRHESPAGVLPRRCDESAPDAARLSPARQRTTRARHGQRADPARGRSGPRSAHHRSSAAAVDLRAAAASLAAQAGPADTPAESDTTADTAVPLSAVLRPAATVASPPSRTTKAKAALSPSARSAPRPWPEPPTVRSAAPAARLASPPRGWSQQAIADDRDGDKKDAPHAAQQLPHRCDVAQLSQHSRGHTAVGGRGWADS